VLEGMFGERFDKSYPVWNINDITNAQMELDGLCMAQRVVTYYRNMGLSYDGIAFEYMGAQHYISDHFFNKRGGFKGFVEQVYRDERKVNLCDAHRIYLITVPYHVKIADIERYIRYYLPEAVLARGGP
jgi:hypothetical protein